MILNSRLHRERNILWKTWAEPTEQNRPQQKAGANNSIILGHFQKCLTHFFRKKVSKFDYVCELGEMFDDNLFGIPVIP